MMKAPVTVSFASIAVLSLSLFFSHTQAVQAGFFKGAIGGAIIGGIIDGGDGAAAGAVIGGIGGAVHESNKRRMAYERERAYQQGRQMQRRQYEQQRMAQERERYAQAQRTSGGGAQTKLVKQTQSALTLMGFDLGPANGELNQATVEAIRAYQGSYQLLATGQPSEELLEHMRQHL